MFDKPTLRSHHEREQHRGDIGFDERGKGKQRHDGKEKNAQAVLKARPEGDCLLFAAETVGSRAADEKSQRAGEDERCELKNTVRQDADKVNAETVALH